MMLLEQIKEATIAGRAEKLDDLLNQAVAEGISTETIINNGFIGAMTIVGDKFSKHEIFVPEMLVAARAMSIGLKILEPQLVQSGRTYSGKIVIGTVQGDLHDIGKNLITMMLRGSGYEVIDLGIDVKAEQFVTAIQEHKPEVIGMASLLTTTMKFMKDDIEAIKSAGLREGVKIIVGGAPVTPAFAESIGADRYVENAGEVAAVVRQLIN